MRLRTVLLLSGVLSVAACNLDAPASLGDAPAVEGLVTEMVQFQRQGGPQCPGTAGVTPENMLCANVNIRYPKVLEAGSPAVAETLNQFIQTQLTEFSDENGKQATSMEEMAAMFIADYQKTPRQPSSWELERQADLVFGKHGIVTLSITESGYTGGAHPFSGQRYFVFDIKTGQQLTLANLLTPGYESALNVAAEHAFREARSIGPEANLESEGFWFENNVFSVNTNVGVLADGLSFIFNPYEVAPYVMGPTEFTVPYDDIKNLISTASPLAGIAH